MLARRNRHRLKEGQVTKNAAAFALCGLRNRGQGDLAGEAMSELSEIMEGARDEPVQSDVPHLLLKANENARMTCMTLRREESTRNLNKVLSSVLTSYGKDSDVAGAMLARIEETQLSAPFPTVSEALRLMKEEQKLHASRAEYDDHMATKFSWLTKRLAEESERADLNEQRVIKVTECLQAKETSRIAHLKKLRELQALVADRITQFREGETRSAETIQELEGTVKEMRERMTLRAIQGPAKQKPRKSMRLRGPSMSVLGLTPPGTRERPPGSPTTTPFLALTDTPHTGAAPMSLQQLPSSLEARPSMSMFSSTAQDWSTNLRPRAAGLPFVGAGMEGSVHHVPQGSVQLKHHGHPQPQQQQHRAGRMSVIDELPLPESPTRGAMVLAPDVGGPQPLPMQSNPADVAEIARLQRILQEVKTKEVDRQQKEQLVDKYLETKTALDKRMSGLMASRSTAAASLEDVQTKLKESVSYCTAKAQENVMLSEQVAALQGQLEEVRGTHAMQDRETRATYDELLSVKEHDLEGVTKRLASAEKQLNAERAAHKAKDERVRNLQGLLMSAPGGHSLAAGDSEALLADPDHPLLPYVLPQAGRHQGGADAHKEAAKKRRTLPSVPAALAALGDGPPPPLPQRCEECTRRSLLELRGGGQRGAGGWSVGGSLAGGSRPPTAGEASACDVSVVSLSRRPSGTHTCEDCGKALTSQQLQRLGSSSSRTSRKAPPLPTPLMVEASAEAEEAKAGLGMPPLPGAAVGRRDSGVQAGRVQEWAEQGCAAVLREIILMKEDEIASLRQLLQIPPLPVMDPAMGDGGGTPSVSGANATPRSASLSLAGDDPRYRHLYTQKCGECTHVTDMLRDLAPKYDALQKQLAASDIGALKRQVFTLTQQALSRAAGTAQCTHCKQGLQRPVECVPCGHTLCEGCAKGVAACPECGEGVADYVGSAALEAVVEDHQASYAVLIKLNRLAQDGAQGL
eukprot:TRINITY_DN25120_c0_g1_i1.p1 TRINITY_DN25120_c0_g1~~TRINITY_DN25120_c0_g1_i1.p1  ORF type:complete len:974 (+),score=365.87 TRINITY_DN25120_c0_g1_i1:165-3086(+)